MKGYTITDVGKVRPENQDRIRFVTSTLPSFGIMALCDGMGGANAGSLASETAAREFTEHLSAGLTAKQSKAELPELIRASVTYANNQVFTLGAADPANYGMGTTLVAAILKGRQCFVVNIGDSRAYIISGDSIRQVTRDHSLVEDMVLSGRITRQEAKTHPQRNIITRAIGVDDSVECDIFTPDPVKNDILVLCSDGLTNLVSDEEILEIVTRNRRLPSAGRELLELALSRGAPDNVTVGLLRK